MKLFRKIAVIVSLCSYLLSSNVFAHVWSMDVADIDYTAMSDCAMHHVSSDGEQQNNCFEKCLGAYDELSTIRVEEESITFSKYLFDGDISLFFYQYDVDSPFGIFQGLSEKQLTAFPDFLDTYIKATKRLE